ncbi:hypothetical protein NV379_23800 [Paenibacillus sp. N1-5-1-14]|uniref:hypothetical protein n=1 Tax=Paenibacillus radicibacter TaxID=2972488 RepID=UPI002158C46F|nr:hypothetical protein [Paenibacillus radicibacter]MCR8645669.1 hypothetical protein [Paenibacillus radicibacter]
MTNSWIVNNYFDYMEMSFPQYHANLSEEDLHVLKELYFSINDFFVICSCFNKSEYESANFFNLINEFKSYISRLLLVVPINDKYLVDSLFRLLIEKLYRILYAHYHVNLLEASIRKHERRKMSSRLIGKLNKKDDLDNLYNEYSELIHHSNPTTSDLLNFRQLSEINVDLITYISEKVEILKEIFIEDFFISKVGEADLDLASKMRLRNQLINQTSKRLEEVSII